MDKEEGEMSDEFMEIDNEEVAPKPSVTVDEDCSIVFKAEKHGPVVKKLEKVDAAKLEERADRFGLNLTGSRIVTQKHIDELYSSCGVDSVNERHFRFDAIHLAGVGGLSTKEIFEYLEDFKPVSLEWVDDDSCNIVCQDHIAAALALLVHSRNIVQEEIKEKLAKKSPHYWREGMPHPKKDLILMRFATNAEKAVIKKNPHNNYDNYDEVLDSVSNNPWGDLSKSWGVYDHQEVFHRKLPKDEYEDEIEEPRPPIKLKNKKLAQRLGKRPIKVEAFDDELSSSDTEWKKKSKAPRMRMHADDVEAKKPKKESSYSDDEDEKDIFAPLSIEIDNSKIDYTPRPSNKLSEKFKFHNKTAIQSKTNNVHSRLGTKINIVEDSVSEKSLEEINDSHSDNDSDQILSRVSRVGSIWSRLDTKSNNCGNSNDLRQRLKSKSKPHKRPGDLRSRLGKSNQSNLRIELDNNLYK